MRLSLRRVGIPRTHGGTAGTNALYSAGSVRASNIANQGELRSSITVVELPGTERLAEDPIKLRLRENTCVHEVCTLAMRMPIKSNSTLLDSHTHHPITQFSDLVRSLSSRSGTDHVWTLDRTQGV